MKKEKKINVGILGFGNMGQAVFFLLKKQMNVNLFICSIGVKKVSGAVCLSDYQELFDRVDYVFICIKPQDFYSLEAANHSNNSLVVISIMAGVKIRDIQAVVGTKMVVRTMPNLALLVGRSTTGWYADRKYFSSLVLEYIGILLDNFGESFFVKEETILNSVTAVTGSGPAYVFLFIDALEKAAEKVGFDNKTAKKIVLSVLEGSVAYLHNEDGANTEDLIKRVKSKKGTTEAAFNSFDINNFYSLWYRAVKAAKKRSEELSSHGVKQNKKKD